jgi:hypothetical protein
MKITGGTVSAEELAVLAAASGYSARARVWVKDSGGTFRNLDDLYGRAWLHALEWNEDIDSGVAECRVGVVAHETEGYGEAALSLAPYNEDSALNNLTGSYSALIRLNAEFYVQVCVYPSEEYPASPVWHEVFRGDIEEVEASTNPITFVGRDLGGRLARRYIEAEAPYGSTGGVALETVCQQILVAVFGGTLMSPTVPLSTLGSTGFDVGPYAQKRVPVLEALRALAVDQIGWDLRYGLNLITFKREALYLQEPDRTVAATDWTITQSRVHATRRLGVNLRDIRNAVEITYSDKDDLDTSGKPKRKTLTLTNSASITKYGRLFMALAEAASSNIDTGTEATALATAALSDLSEPIAEVELELDLQPFLELNDRVVLEPDGLFYTEEKTLAVTKLTHRIGANGRHLTTVALRGKPCSGVGRWLQVEQAPGVAPTSPYSGPQAPTVTEAGEVTGGAEIVWEPPKWGPRPGEYEVHVNSTPGFTPGPSTFKGAFSATKAVLTGLAPGVTQYVQILPKGRNGRDAYDYGTASAEESFTPRYVEPRILQPRVTYASLPLNSDFEAYNDTSVPPDGWEMVSPFVWSTHFSISTDTNSGTRAVVLGPTATSDPELASQLFVAYPDTRYALRCRFKSSVATGTPALDKYPKMALRWYSDTTTVISTTSLIPTLVDANVWGTLVGVVTAPSTAKLARVILSSLSNASGQTIIFDSVSVELASIPLGDTTFASFVNSFTDAGGGAGIAQHYLNGNDEVCIMGAIARASAPAAGTVIFTLPAGRRPSRERGFAVATDTGAGVVLIATNGDVKYMSGGLTAMYLDGIRFRLDDNG